MQQSPIAAELISPSAKQTIYPEPFAALVTGRIKRQLGDYFELSNFGINLTQLAPDAISALQHRHLTQDEFIYILTGTPTLILGSQETLLQPGDCMGFKAGASEAHQLINRTTEPVNYLEVGDRSPSDEVDYPNADLKATLQPEGVWLFTHKDGSVYER